KANPNFSMASMSDLVFLLLIFFMVTSTMVAPNAIKLLLPQSESRTIAKQSVTVYIDENQQYLMAIGKANAAVVGDSTLMYNIEVALAGIEDGSVVLRSAYNAPIQLVVNIYDIVDNINKKYSTKHKVILATKPKD
ncbi:MAG: biopolymer transporter ExbD, partial [Bacteroidales bacterium]|nr:biopolymer transporter ExbD [Bacteroidales bacterium]